MDIVSVDSCVSDRDAAWIAVAEKMSQMSCCRQRHGAIVYKSGRILGRGINFYRNLPCDAIPAGCISVHAEIAATRRIAPCNLVGSTVYVARSHFALSKPCSQCEKALRKAGVKRVVYSCRDIREHIEKQSTLNERC